MNTFLSTLKTSLLALLAFTTITGVAYPLAVTALAQSLFPQQAAGSLLKDSSGKVRGSVLLAQAFSQDRYFHPRPSATNYQGSGGSNAGPQQKACLERLASLEASNNTASASGLDPHLSPAQARAQVGRVAKARGLNPASLLKQIEASQEDRLLGLWGEPVVNVLALNWALDHQP